MKKTSEHQQKAVIVLTLVSILALLALIFPYTQNNTTAMMSATQMIYSQPVLYQNSRPNTYNIVQTNNPCKPVHSSNRAVPQGHPITDLYGKVLTDENGNVWCKINGQAELYYRVSTKRKY